jgi:hypothetical protein
MALAPWTESDAGEIHSKAGAQGLEINIAGNRQSIQRPSALFLFKSERP